MCVCLMHVILWSGLFLHLCIQTLRRYLLDCACLLQFVVLATDGGTPAMVNYTIVTLVAKRNQHPPIITSITQRVTVLETDFPSNISTISASDKDLQVCLDNMVDLSHFILSLFIINYSCIMPKVKCLLSTSYFWSSI